MIEMLPLLLWPPRRAALTIFAYHRVLSAPDPLRPGEVVSEVFEEHMRFLSMHFAVLPLAEACRLLKSGKLPRRACCITFDDGYSDNLTIALPIMQCYRLPATVFVATGFLDGQRMFNDAVIDAIGACETAYLDLEDLDLGSYPLRTPEERLSAVISILRRFRYRPPETRQAELSRLLDISGCGTLPAGMMLDREQVRELARQGVDIGAHTVTHPVMTSVPDERAHAELIASKSELESITGKAVSTFAYPNGKPQRDYSARHVAMVKSAGFDLAVTTSNGVATRESDVFQLPRFMPWGSSIARLATRLVSNAWMGRTVSVC